LKRLGPRMEAATAAPGSMGRLPLGIIQSQADK